MKIEVNDLVIFRKDLYADEEGAVYRVLEINDERCVLEFLSVNMAIRPQSIAILSELEKLNERNK